ncbi:MAG: hypothetical protein NC918_04025 [Candidatus Omnitrophica bacterium]|nr:hypothetical protein [Candidatus Omnitrophota bacterium]
MSNFLERKGLKVFRAQNGQEAIKFYQECGADCVF